MPRNTRLFTSADLPILEHALSIHANLEYASYAAKLAKKHLKFPLKAPGDLNKLLRIKNLPERIAARKIRPAHVRKYFPKEFFPIEDVGDFLGKTLASLSWGDRVHAHEKFLKNPEKLAPFQYRVGR